IRFRLEFVIIRGIHVFSLIRVHQCSSVVKFFLVTAPLRCVHPWLNFLWLFLLCFSACCAEPAFKVIAFYTGPSAQAHMSFSKDANRSLPIKAAENNFSYSSTTNWTDLNADFLRQYQVVLFLDTRPESTAQREAFKSYMEHGGAWMGFHCA